MLRRISLKVFALLIIPITSVLAGQQPSWKQFVKQLRVEAVAQGIRPEVFDQAFRNVKAPSRRVLSLDRNQPEKRITFLKYRHTRADNYRIVLGKREIKKYSSLLSDISREYGVSPCFIVSLWGMESSYGRYRGNFPVINSLATLAYNKRRGAYFRKQLFYALHILNEGHVSLSDFKGEWAGASGHPQFLPSSWHNFAVDYNQDGRKDIWHTMSDVFASIANYLVQNGWKSNQPWAINVNTPPHFDKALMTRKVRKSISEWQQMGVRPISGSLPRGDLEASVVRPLGGPTMMVFNNFNVIMRWNRSIYYAGTIGWMAEKICRRKL